MISLFPGATFKAKEAHEICMIFVWQLGCISEAQVYKARI
jgi:hypothetical protein